MSGDDRLDQLDYYELLSVEEGASADDVRRAFHAFAVKYHPDRHSDGSPEKVERAAQIYRRGAEAYRVLCDREQRRVYDDQRSRGKVRFDPEDVPRTSEGPGTGSIQVRSPRARPFVQKASDAYKKGDWAAAKLNLKIALQHDAGNALLEARLADVEQKLKK